MVKKSEHDQLKKLILAFAAKLHAHEDRIKKLEGGMYRIAAGTKQPKKGSGLIEDAVSLAPLALMGLGDESESDSDMEGGNLLNDISSALDIGHSVADLAGKIGLGDKPQKKKKPSQRKVTF